MLYDACTNVIRLNVGLFAYASLPTPTNNTMVNCALRTCLRVREVVHVIGSVRRCSGHLPSTVSHQFKLLTANAGPLYILAPKAAIAIANSKSSCRPSDVPNVTLPADVWVTTKSSACCMKALASLMRQKSQLHITLPELPDWLRFAVLNSKTVVINPELDYISLYPLL